MKLTENIESMNGVSISFNEKYSYPSISNGEDEIFMQEVEVTYEEVFLFIAEFYTSVIWSN